MDRPRINRRLVLFAVVALLVGVLMWQARSALVPFLAGLVVAYLISPLVNRVHRAMPVDLRDRSAGRPLAILVVYGVAIAVVVGATALIIPPLLRQAQALLLNAPSLYEQAQLRINELVVESQRFWPWQTQTEELLDEALRSDAVQSITLTGLDVLRRGGLATVGALSSTVSWVLAFVIVPIWVVYILNDSGRVMGGALGLVPRDIRPDVESGRIICDQVLSAYIRGQLVIALVLGFMVTIGLGVVGVPYALLLGFIAGVLGLIPFIGAILGLIPALAVALGESLQMALLVVAIFIVVQLVDNMFVSPRVQGDAVALHPALIMVVLVMGQQLLGPIGLLAAVPITAILRDVVHYAYLRVGEDEPSPRDALVSVGFADAVTPLVSGTAPDDDVRVEGASTT